MEEVITPNAVEIIQLALAPIFLIVGIGTLVNVATGRVSRIIDRARWFEQLARTQPSRIDHHAKREIRSLKKRLRLANWTINFLIASALTICFEVSLLMINGLISASLDTTILVMFMISMLFLTGGLIAFFFEVSVATATLKINASSFQQIDSDE